MTGSGANITLTDLQSSSSCPGLTDEHSEISIWLAFVHTLCDNSRPVRSRQLFPTSKKKEKIKHMNVYVIENNIRFKLLFSSFPVTIRFKFRIRITIDLAFVASKRWLSRKLSISARNGMAAISFAVTLIILSLDAAVVGSKIRTVQIFIWKRMSENYFSIEF